MKGNECCRRWQHAVQKTWGSHSLFQRTKVWVQCEGRGSRVTEPFCLFYFLYKFIGFIKTLQCKYFDILDSSISCTLVIFIPYYVLLSLLCLPPFSLLSPESPFYVIHMYTKGCGDSLVIEPEFDLPEPKLKKKEKSQALGLERWQLGSLLLQIWFPAPVSGSQSHVTSILKPPWPLQVYVVHINSHIHLKIKVNIFQKAMHSRLCIFLLVLARHTGGPLALTSQPA